MWKPVRGRVGCKEAPGKPGIPSHGESSALQPDRWRVIALSRRILVSLVLAVATATAWAHRPSFSDGTAVDPEHALVVKDPVMSQVYYHEVTKASPVIWLAFDLKQDQEIYLQIGVPVLDRLRDYRPSFALVGPGLPRAHLPFAIPAGTGARVWRTAQVRQPQFFHEPFTGTDSWILRETRVRVPQAGRYYAVAFVPYENPGKLWLAIGTQEKWDPAEFAKLGEIGRKIRAFHEVGSKPEEAGGRPGLPEVRAGGAAQGDGMASASGGHRGPWAGRLRRLQPGARRGREAKAGRAVHAA